MSASDSGAIHSCGENMKLLWKCLFLSLVSQAAIAEDKTLPTVNVTAPRVGRGYAGYKEGGMFNLNSLLGMYIFHTMRPYIRNDGVNNKQNKNSSDKDCSQQVANPVIISTGNKIEPEPLFTTSGEAPLEVSLTFNNYFDGGGISLGWITNYTKGLSLYYPDANTITLINPDGRNIRYIKGSDGVFYEDKKSPVSKIVVTGTLEYTLYGEDNSKMQFTGSRLMSYRNGSGIGWDYIYDGLRLLQIKHTSGREIKFIWDGDFTNSTSKNWISKIIDPAGNEYGLEYKYLGTGASTRLLTKIVKPGVPPLVIDYFYEDPRFPDALTGKSYNGIRYSKFSYDENRRAVSSEHYDGVEKYTFAYAVNTDGYISKTTTVNPLGKQTSYYFDSKGNITKTEGVASTHCPSSLSSQTFDANGNPDRLVDFNGNVTDADYNDKGQLVKTVEAYGTPQARTTIIDWDSGVNRVLGVTKVGVSKVTYSYNSDNRISKIETTNLLAPLPANNINQKMTVTYAYTKHPNGMVATVIEDGPISGAGDAIVSTYDDKGNLVSVKNTLGQAVTYSNHNGLGLPGRVVGANGDITDYTYDAQGHVLEEITHRNGGTQSTRYTYDSFGRLSLISKPDGRKIIYTYDVAGRLLSEAESEPGGSYAQRIYTYDKMSNPTSIKTQRIFSEPASGTLP